MDVRTKTMAYFMKELRRFPADLAGCKDRVRDPKRALVDDKIK